MSPAIEFTIVGMIVAVAAIVMGIKLFRFVRGAKPGCGTSCGSCGSSASRTGVEKPLVQLQSFPTQKRS